MRSSADRAVQAILLLLVARDKTKTWLASELGESQFWVGRRLNGTVTPDLQDLDRIAGVFGISVPEMLAIPDAIPAPREQREAVGA